MSGQSVYVRAAGMACPVGLSWAAACAAMRAGISRRWISPYRDNEGREIVASYLRDGFAQEGASVEPRWLTLLAHALRQIAREVGADALEHVPLLLALPVEARSPAQGARSLADALGNRLQISLDPAKLQIFTEGAYGGLVAVQQSRELARRGQPCIVAAADSLLSARVLLRMSEQQRLLVEGNSDGVIPGEAAAALMLTESKVDALGVVRGLGFANESATLSNDIPLRADGLAAAAHAALQDARLQLHEVDFRFADAAGESFYFKEQALLLARLLRERKAEFPLWLCAESLGDTGAAAGLCGMLWAMAGWARNYAPGPRAIGFAGNEDGGRAAVVIERVG